MASDITISSLTAVGGLGQVALTAVPQVPLGMTCLAYMQPAGVQFWVSTTNNRNNATLLATSDVGFTVHGGLGDSVTRYYWARAVDQEGNFGPFYPASATAGVSATTKTATPGPNSITEEMLQNGVVSRQKFTSGITPVEIVASLPATGNYEGRMVYLTTTNKLYRHTGSPAGASGFTVAVDGGDVTANTLHGNSIIAGTVSAAAMSVSKLSAISADLGEVTAGSVTGVTFTGGMIRTAASGQRSELSAANARLRFFNASNANIATFGGWSAADPKIILTLGAGFQISGGLATLTTNTIVNTGNGIPLQCTAEGNQSTAHGFRALNSANGGGSGLVGVPGTGGGYAFFAENGSYGPFTGAHPCLLRKEDAAVPGDILIDVRVLARGGVSDTLTEVRRSSDAAERAAIGVLDGRVPFEADALLNVSLGPVHRRHFVGKYDLATVNGLGEGQVNVCGLGGNIKAGDFICTSSIPGKGQRQNDADGEADDLVRRCTVARAREDVTFTNPTDVKLVSCIYLCG